MKDGLLKCYKTTLITLNLNQLTLLKLLWRVDNGYHPEKVIEKKIYPAYIDQNSVLTIPITIKVGERKFGKNRLSLR